jgi:hypothetical protein
VIANIETTIDDDGLLRFWSLCRGGNYSRQEAWHDEGAVLEMHCVVSAMIMSTIELARGPINTSSVVVTSTLTKQEPTKFSRIHGFL